MNLLKNRPLTVFCLIFILSACIIYRIDSELKPILALVAFLCLLLCLGVAFFSEKARIKAIYALLCCFFSLVAIVSQFLSIDMRRASALSYEGERNALILITEEKYSSRYSSEYEAKLKEIDGKRVSFDTILCVSFSADVEAGDMIYARVRITPMGKGHSIYDSSFSENAYIQTEIYDSDKAVRVSADNLNPTIFFNSVRSAISEYMDDLFGEELSALSRGFLLGDRSDISADVVRDFRRSGTSHLLAISGFHISVLMAALETVLRRLSIGKRVRCVLLSLTALFFLGVTGFSMSACRSVIMLLCVYFSYLFVSENDSLTSLFVSVSLIMLIFPHSVIDVGLWLSFLATLGIISVYIPLSSYFQKPPERGWLGYLKVALKKLLLAILVTFICNIFICMISWLVFGEISVISILANVVTSPLSEVFVIFIPIACAVGHIPIIGYASVRILAFIAELMVALCRYFSEISGAVVSLRYPFAGVIIILMSVAITVMLLINLRRKWTVILPPVAASALFCVCLLIYNGVHAGEVKATYYSYKESRAIILTERYSATVCDLYTGDYTFLNSVQAVMSENMATEISDYVVTDYREGIVGPLERLFNRTLLRRIYLPQPESREEYAIAEKIEECAKASGVEVIAYSERDRLAVLDSSYVSAVFSEDSDASPTLVIGNGESTLSYIDVRTPNSPLIDKISSSSSFLIFGGSSDAGVYSYKTDKERLRAVLYLDEKLYRASRTEHGKAALCVAPENKKETVFELVLE